MMSFFEEQAQANPEAFETFIEETEKLTHEEIEHLRVLVTAGAPVFIRNKETGGWMGGQEFLKKLVQE